MTRDELEELAELVADRLRDIVAPRVELLDAGQLAERLGRSREFVRDHAAELGAVRLGSRLAFRWPDALNGLRSVEAARSGSGGSAQPEKPATAGRSAHRRSRRAGTGAPLLPVKGSGGL